MEKRDRRLVIYVEPSLFAELEKRAEEAGYTISSLVRGWLLTIAGHEEEE